MKKFLFIFVYIFFTCHATTVSIKSLDDSTVQKLRAYQQKHPGRMTILWEPDFHVVHQAIGWGEWIMGATNLATGKSDGWFSIRPILQWMLGGSFVTYGAGIYVIYRAYRLLNKIGSWTNLTGKEEEEQIVLYIRSKNSRRQDEYCQQIITEKNILERYLNFHDTLQKAGIRWLFPRNKAYDYHIKKRVARLTLLEKHFENKK